MRRYIINTEDIIKTAVHNHQGEHLGKIEALMLDKVEGRIAYVVLSTDMDDKLFALPWSTFSYNALKDTLSLTIDKEKLIHSPSFDRSNWPDMSNPIWSTTISSYYQAFPLGRSH
ncbi:PRC-barrel domain-containing protein [Legionella fallonii]|uniref:PRC-barrel n=1 Tax=Legionella fallonii LLAP-10 TaxID=1212491 RepID=A0A098G209_9GAMM